MLIPALHRLYARVYDGIKELHYITFFFVVKGREVKYVFFS